MLFRQSIQFLGVLAITIQIGMHEVEGSHQVKGVILEDSNQDDSAFVKRYLKSKGKGSRSGTMRAPDSTDSGASTSGGKSKAGKTNGGGGGSKNNKSGGGSDYRGGEVDGGGSIIYEVHDCAEFESERVTTLAASSFSDDECSGKNACGGGCCRIYNWLICDTNYDSYSTLQCVCNENTRPVTTPSLSATLSPTPRPTLSPTPRPTSTLPVPSPTPPLTTAPVLSSNNNAEGESNAGQDDNGRSGTNPAETCAYDEDTHPYLSTSAFSSFTPCYGGESICPNGTCCVKTVCFCIEPFDWDNDCVSTSA